MKLPESEKNGRGIFKELPRPPKCDYLFRATIFKGRLTLKELGAVHLRRRQIIGGEGSALFSVLSTSYVLDMGREGSKNGEKTSTS